MTTITARTATGGSDAAASLHAAPPVLLLAVAFGLATGLAELGLQAIRIHVLDRYSTDLSPHASWMTPLANVGVFLAAGVLLLGGARLLRRRLSWAAVMGVFTAIALLPPFIIYRKIHWLAVLVLTAAIGIQAARMVAPRRAIVRRILALAVAVMCVLVMLLAAAATATLALGSRRALAALPAADDASPNVLLIVLDTVRRLSMSLYGHDRETTPGLAAFADRALVFTQAYSTSGWTLPSHASMFTGRLPGETKVSFTRPLDGTWPTLAELLAANGYVTAGFVANAGYAGRQSGLGRGFAIYRDHPISTSQVLRSAAITRGIVRVPAVRRALGYHEMLGRKSAEDINRDMLDFLDAQDNRPYFVFLNYFDAHAPYLPDAPYNERFGVSSDDRVPLLVEEPFIRAQWPSPRLEGELAAYEQALTQLDRAIATLLADMQDRGALENTIVIVTSDHGEGFGEHGVHGHAYSLNTPVLGVPLIIFDPRARTRRVIDESVSLRDLPATIMELARVRDHPFPGRSLASRPAEEGQAFSSVYSEEADWRLRSLISDDYHLLVERDSITALYQPADDPFEQHNLLDTEEGRTIAAKLLPLLRAEASAARDTGSAPTKR